MEPKIFIPIRQQSIVDKNGIQTLRLNKFFDQVSRNLWNKSFEQDNGTVTYYTLSSTPAIVAVTRSLLTAYQKDDQVWLLDFNISYTVASAARTQAILNIDTVKFKAETGLYQSTMGYAIDGNAVTENCYAEQNTGNIILNHTNATTTIYTLSGHAIELEEKPGFAE